MGSFSAFVSANVKNSTGYREGDDHASYSFLANFDLGATGHPHEPSEAELNCAQRLKPFMQENRLSLTAIDMIGGKISQINLTSPGLVRQTNEAMGEKLEVRMQDFYEEAYRRHAERLKKKSSRFV